MGLLRSWVESANREGCEFPLNNLPCGVFSVGQDEPRCGTSIANMRWALLLLLMLSISKRLWL